MKTGKGIFLTMALASFKASTAFAPGVIAQTTDPPGRSTIRGRALYEDTDRPARRAEVQLFAEDEPRSRKGVTDAKGEFIFRNLAAGSYRVMVGFQGNLHGSPRFETDKAKIYTPSGIHHSTPTIMVMLRATKLLRLFTSTLAARSITSRHIIH